MQRTDFTYFYELRVRYAEVDSQGIVFNAHYLTYFDTALTEYMRHLQYDYQALVNVQRLDFHLVKSTVEYRLPIAFDALLEIGVRAEKIGNTSLTWRLGIFEKGQEPLKALGEIIWVCAAVGTHQSHPLPAGLVALLQPQALPGPG